MRSDIDLHHLKEAELELLRLRRDLQLPGYDAEAEDTLLDELEVIWNRLNDHERLVLEEERGGESPAPLRSVPAGELVEDTDEESYGRRGLSLRRLVSCT